MKKALIRSSMILFLAISLLGLPIVSGNIASLFDYRSIDPQGVFMWISVHHIVQALFFIIFILMIKGLIILLKKSKYKDSIQDIPFGFGLGDTKAGTRYLFRFTLFFMIYTIIGFTIAIAFNSFNPPWYRLDSRNIIGYLGFQLLLSGPSEEILFRAFGITLMAFVWNKKLLKENISIANLIIAVLFGLAHIGIYFSPFRLSYDLFQVFYAFALGLIYGHCYEKTGSVIYPMAIHSISNVIAVGTTILVTFFIG